MVSLEGQRALFDEKPEKMDKASHDQTLLEAIEALPDPEIPVISLGEHHAHLQRMPGNRSHS
ncbi:MAG: hypothetical protein EBS52_08920 [Betaproteobacteria bacterium]|nr:hypothetical protein [Betaproteobacteria bacterium]